MSELRILIVGAGTVGLPLACLLVQAGCHLALVDHDRIEERNLAKQFYGDAQIGQTKVEAAAALLRGHRPTADLSVHIADVRSFGTGFFRRFDLVAACVDNRAAERYCAERANQAGIGFLRLATTAPTRQIEVTLVPPPRGPEDPCGACTFTSLDHSLADLRNSCLDERERNPDAGAPTAGEHGAVAAGLAAEAILRGELGPARVLRYYGGPIPRLKASRILPSSCCRLADCDRRHGPLPLEAVLDPEESVASLMARAEERLGRSSKAITVEPDVPFCPTRICLACGRRAAPAFRVWMREGPRCTCGGPLMQEAGLPWVRFGARRLARYARAPLVRFGPPVGLGLVFTTRGGGRWTPCLGEGTRGTASPEVCDG